MPADLRIAVFGGCAFFKIHRLEDGVLSVLLLNGESRLLDFSLALQSGVLGFLYEYKFVAISIVPQRKIK